MIASKYTRGLIVWLASCFAAWTAEAHELSASGASDRFRPAVSFDGIFGDRHGIEGNDYGASVFMPWHFEPDRNLVFVVLRGAASDVQKFVANVGVGHRVYVEPLNSILGSSLWYDFDKSRAQAYHRVGGQVEYYCRFVELRGGVDIVLQGTETTLVAPAPDDAQPLFVGHNIAWGFFTAETPYDHGYFEAGGPLPLIGRFGLNVYAGAYALWADDLDQTVGWQARIAADVTRDLQLGARFTQDDQFGSNFSASVVLTVPQAGMKQMIHSLRAIVAGWSRPRSVIGRISNHVVRDHRTPVKRTITSKPVLATAAGTQQSLYLLHVDPNASAAGNGTIENPYRSLDAARLANNGNVHIIRVVRRNDNTGTNLSVTAPFQLFPNQRLLSASVHHEVAATRGTFQLPGFTGGSAPHVTNSMAAAAAVVEMANSTEVSGFTIDGSGRHVGLRGAANSFHINRNTVQAAIDGVQLQSGGGSATVIQNTFRDNANDGAHITVTGDDGLDLEVAENTGTGNGDDAVDITATGTFLSVRFVDNQFAENSGDGISLTTRLEANVAATLLHNRLGASGSKAGNGQAGFRFNSDSGFATLNFGGSRAAEGNVMLGNAGRDLEFELSDTAAAFVSSQNNVMPAPPSGGNSFEIEIEYGSNFTAAQRAKFESAVARWESIVIGDLPDIGSLDDVRIVATIGSIDGAGGTLAEAGPSGLRADSYLPFLGNLRFDSADLFSVEASGKLEGVIRHEIAHALGFGTIWHHKGLISGAGGSDPRFLGTRSVAEYNARFGTSDSGVPLDNSGEEGTADAHWRESIFADELMTGSIDGTTQPISRITIGQFIDLGYTADMSQADPF